MADKDAKMTHAWEQAGAALAEMAATLGRYREHLENEGGFTREEAMALCLQWQQTMLLAGTLKDAVGLIAESVRRRLNEEDVG